jgi:large conductance mechanosensitive channel
MFKEFKEFALKGNLIDMSVAFVMGAAFTKLSTAFIEGLVMPFVGLLSGGMDFTNKFLPLSDKVTATSLVEAKKQGAVVSYGEFITISINKAKAIAIKEEAAAAPAAPPAQEVLLAEIRDLLKQKN